MRQTTDNYRCGIKWTLLTQLEDLEFADDIALLSQNHVGMQFQIDRLAFVSAETGLKSKTKLMRANTRNAEKIEMDEAAIDKVYDFTYRGSTISRDGGTYQDIQAMIGNARIASQVMLMHFWRSKVISKKIKLRIFNINVKPVLLYV